jgi:hypothetical protein
VLFSPDGRWLLAGTPSECALWDVASWTVRLRVDRVSGPMAFEQMAFSPDSSILALTPAVSSVRLLALPSGQELGTLEAPDPWPISSLRFTPDAAHLVVAGGTRFIHVWDLRLLRENLVAMKLDWEQPRLPPATPGPNVTRVIVREAEPLPAPTFPMELSQRIPPHDPQAPKSLIDLTPNYNAALADEWHVSGWNNGFGCVPLGLQKWAGVDFDVRGVIQLAGQRLKQRGAHFPEAVRGLKLSRNCSHLHFLQAASRKENEGTSIGSYIIHYAGGTSHELPIHYGEDVRSWWAKDDPKPDLLRGRLAWTGINTAGFAVRLWLNTQENPLPDTPIESIDFISNLTQADPFLLAITVE